MKASKARRLRALIEALAAYLDDREALEAVALYPKWEPDTEYTRAAGRPAGHRVRHGDKLYKLVQEHTSQLGWEPGLVSMWTRVVIPDECVICDWVQPDSTNGYMLGDKVRYREKIWVSVLDHNIWEPGVYGWEEAA